MSSRTAGIRRAFSETLGFRGSKVPAAAQQGCTTGDTGDWLKNCCVCRIWQPGGLQAFWPTTSGSYQRGRSYKSRRLARCPSMLVLMLTIPACHRSAMALTDWAAWVLGQMSDSIVSSKLHVERCHLFDNSRKPICQIKAVSRGHAMPS